MTATTTREVTFSYNGQPHRHPAGTPVAVERHRRNGTAATAPSTSGSAAPSTP